MWERESAGLEGSSRRRGWTARKYVGERERVQDWRALAADGGGQPVNTWERECRIEGL